MLTSSLPSVRTRSEQPGVIVLVRFCIEIGDKSLVPALVRCGPGHYRTGFVLPFSPGAYNCFVLNDDLVMLCVVKLCL